MRSKRFVPSEWDLVRLGEIASIEIGGTPARNEPRYWDSAKRTANRWVAIRDIQDRFLDDTGERISDEGAKNSNAKLFPAGTLLMSFKLSIGRVTIPKNPVYTNEAIAAIITDDRAERDFMFYALPRAALAEASDVAIKGSTLNKSKLKALRLLLPPITEQRSIMAILSSIDTAIERTRAVIDQVRVVKQALLADLMTNGLPGRHKKFKTVKHIGRLPELWDDEAVGALATDRKAICYGVVQPGGHVADGTPFIRVTDIEGGVVSTNDLKRIDPAISAQYTRSLLDGGELLVTLVGAIGRCAVTPVACRGFNIARAVGKVPLRSSVNARFVMHALNSTRNAALIGGSFESARMTLNLDQLVRVRVPIPEIDEQDRIVEIVDTVIAREQTEVKALGQLSNVKSALSDALLTGRVRVIKEKRK